MRPEMLPEKSGDAARIEGQGAVVNSRVLWYNNNAVFE